MNNLFHYDEHEAYATEIIYYGIILKKDIGNLSKGRKFRSATINIQDMKLEFRKENQTFTFDLEIKNDSESSRRDA